MTNEPGYEIGVYVLMCINWVEASLILIWLTTFYKLSNLSLRTISVRRPQAVILFNILCCIGLYIRFPLQIYLSINMGPLFNKFYGFQTLLAFISPVGIRYVVLYRTWMVYYEIKCIQSLQDAQWINHIDTTNQQRKQWYILNRKIFGNKKYVIFMLFIPWSLFATVGTIAGFILGRHKIVHMCLLGSSIITTCLLCVLSYKLPKFNDLYKLRKETHISALSTAAFLSITLIALATRGRASPGTWIWIMINFMSTLMMFSLAMFSLLGVFIIFDLPKLPCRVNQYKVGVTFEHNNQIDVKNCKLFDVFKDYELFTLFARHLCKEFAIESVLFFLETQQFMECISQYLEEECLSSLSLKSDIEFSTKLPKSSIVKGVKDLNGAMNASIQLFAKYIESDNAEFLINISWEQREALYQFFGRDQIKNTSNTDNINQQMKQFMIKNGTNWKNLYVVFHECRLSVFQLMSFSFSRFNESH
eukprot:502123_1